MMKFKSFKLKLNPKENKIAIWLMNHIIKKNKGKEKKNG